MSKVIPARFRRFFGLFKWVGLAALIMIPAVGYGSMQLENHDGFCASCHTDPESEYVARTLAGSAIDLATFHTGEGVRCIDCHSGEGTSGRIQAMTLGAHDLLKFISGSFPQPAPLTQSISDVQCTKCHNDIAQSRNFNNHFHFFLPTWQQLTDTAATCTECHESHNTNGNVQIAFLDEQHTVPICQRCHSFNQGRG